MPPRPPGPSRPPRLRGRTSDERPPPVAAPRTSDRHHYSGISTIKLQYSTRGGTTTIPMHRYPKSYINAPLSKSDIILQPYLSFLQVLCNYYFYPNYCFYTRHIYSPPHPRRYQSRIRHGGYCSLRQSVAHMHTGTLCTGSMPSGSALRFHHHLSLFHHLLHALGHGVTVHRATWRGQDYP